MIHFPDYVEPFPGEEPRPRADEESVFFGATFDSGRFNESRFDVQVRGASAHQFRATPRRRVYVDIDTAK